MVRQDRRPSNRNGSQGEQPPAASARTESPDGLEDIERVVRLSVADSNRLFAELSDWNEILKDVSVGNLAEFDDPANDQLDADEALKSVLGGGHD